MLGGAIGLAMRGDSRLSVPVGAATKYASLVAIPHGWFNDRRGLLIGAAIAGCGWGISIALAPAAWGAYANHLLTVPPAAPAQLLFPALPLPVQLSGAAIASLASVRWPRVLPVACLLAFPVLGATAPAVLAACVSPTSPTSWRSGGRGRIV
jgi:hypothetical protein